MSTAENPFRSPEPSQDSSAGADRRSSLRLAVVGHLSLLAVLGIYFVYFAWEWDRFDKSNKISATHFGYFIRGWVLVFGLPGIAAYVLHMRRSPLKQFLLCFVLLGILASLVWFPWRRWLEELF